MVLGFLYRIFKVFPIIFIAQFLKTALLNFEHYQTVSKESRVTLQMPF